MAQIQRSGRISFGDASLNVWEDPKESVWGEWGRRFKKDVFLRMAQQLRRLGWKTEVPADMVELKAKGDDGVVRARQVDLDSDEMQQLLDSGRQASKLALEIEGRLAFVLHDDLALKSLRFGDALLDEANQADDEDDALVRLETDFLLMAQALGASVDRLLEWLGGEAGH